MAGLNHLFTDFVDWHSKYHDALRIVQQNSRGRIWVIGGFVYRSLAQQLYGTSLQACDFDFMAEEVEPKLRLPAGWEEQRNSHGNPKLVSPDQTIDLIPLHNMWYFVEHGITPTIERFLERTPLTVGSIAYDTVDRRIFGEVGERALYDKTVAVHHPDVAARVAAMKGITVDDLVRQKAESLGFTAILPS